VRFNFVDFFTLAYVLFGSRRGRTRGLGGELPRLIGVSLFFVTGGGLYHWTETLMIQMSAPARQTSGALGLIGVLVGAYFVARQIRARVRSWAEQNFPGDRTQKLGGCVAGGLRAFVIASCLILFFSALPLGFLVAPFRQGSLVGRTLNRLVAPARRNAPEKSGAPAADVQRQ
jgi:uncharacterized membrane protein required for colicin V production